MSIAPLNFAPSARTTRGETMSPRIVPEVATSTLSSAVMLPLTSPSTMTVFAWISAVIFPFVPIVRLWSLRLIFPSTFPSIVRSSFPVSSPLMWIDCPMFTILSIAFSLGGFRALDLVDRLGGAVAHEALLVLERALEDGNVRRPAELAERDRRFRAHVFRLALDEERAHDPQVRRIAGG